MNKKLVLSAALLMMLVSCGGGNNTSKNDTTSESSSMVSSKENFKGRDVDYPTEIPTLQEDSIRIHYQRKDNSYAKWALWMWAKSADGTHYGFNYQDEFGVVASYPLSTFASNTLEASLGFIIKEGNNATWTSKDVDTDRYIDFSSLKKDRNGAYNIYLFQGDENIYLDENKTMANKINTCKLMYEKANDKFDFFIDTSTKMKSYVVYEDGVSIAEGTTSSKTKHIYLDAGRKVDIKKNYKVKVTFLDNSVLESDVNMNLLFTMDDFNEKYYYDGELGAIYTNEKTTFKVWSPIATKIEMKIYSTGTPKSIDAVNGSDTPLQTLEMVEGEKGVYSQEVTGDLEGKYYTYVVYSKNYPQGKEIVDPYAKSCGINGLRGMVVDFSKTNPERWDDVSINPYDRKQLVVYETHLVDVTSSSSWGGNASNSKKYLGLAEEGTRLPTNTSIKTGFDHIKELGVNAIQLQPIFDYNSNEVNPEFNWGYDPLNYNSLEGSYSNNPYDGYERIKEFKKVVKAYTNAGINVIMDVVYNHVNAAQGSNFDVLCPGYYYRYDGAGLLTNGSGCGNETASENKMMSKFIVDSVKFWASEYKLGGFRFDLMGLHDIDTMNKVASELKALNEHITVYGEPWTGGTSGMRTGVTAATQVNGNKYVGYGQFNDQMRDALIKGGLSAATDKGWITNETTVSSSDVTKIEAGLQGITKGGTIITDPNKSVNYATCHDNYTLYDRIKAAGITSEDTILDMAQLANATVLTAQGTTFILAGEEMLRTKGGDSNSYKSGYKVNELDYSKLADPKISSLFENYKKLISFKTSTPALRYEEDVISSKMNVSNLENGSVITYTLEDSDAIYTVYHANGTLKDNKVIVNLEGQEIIVDTKNITSSNNYLTKYQTLVLKKRK